ENEFTKQIILHKDLSLKLKTDDFKKNFYKSIQEEIYWKKKWIRSNEFSRSKFYSIKISSYFKNAIFIIDKRMYSNPHYLFIIPEYFFSFKQISSEKILKKIIIKTDILYEKLEKLI
ncbi:hypothetical protein, partial [Mycoplasmopsis cricetuli]|uniref:hypothetical protein n=1 Tax=Mycoplasmopsis cricetuli TaxID=171283 RepID=UPI00055F8359